MQPIPDLARSASLVFVGTVVNRGVSRIPILPARDSLIEVRVDRALRADPVLGDLRGQMVTVETATPGELEPGRQAIFFTRSWLHGKEIAVHEIAHLDVQSETEVASAVAGLPDMHLKDRLAGARVVVLAEVSEIREVPNQVLQRGSPIWAVAVLRVGAVLKGTADSALLFFPTSESHHWIKAPRFQSNQRGIFLLRADDPGAGRWLDTQILGPNPMTALDPADFQPESRLNDIRSLLAGQ